MGNRKGRRTAGWLLLPSIQSATKFLTFDGLLTIFSVDQEAQRLKGRIKRLEGEAQDLKNMLDKERREREEEGERARVAIEEAAAAATAAAKAAVNDEVRFQLRVSREFQRLQVV